MKSYAIDYTHSCMTITKDFEDKAQNPKSAEAKLLHEILTAFPNMTVSRKTHSKPSSYHNSDGSITKSNQNKGLTYAKMERFINTLPNSEELKKAYNFLKAVSTYTKVAQWFHTQFPYYNSNPLVYLNSTVFPISATEFMTADEFEEYADIDVSLTKEVYESQIA